MGVHRVALNAFLQVYMQPACKHPSVNLCDVSAQPVHKLWALFLVLVLHLTLTLSLLSSIVEPSQYSTL